MPNTAHPEGTIELPPVAHPTERVPPADVSRAARITTIDPYFQYATSKLVIVIVLSMLMSDAGGLTGMLVTDPTNVAAKDATSVLSGSSSIFMNGFVIMGLGGIKKSARDLHDEFDRLDSAACESAEEVHGKVDRAESFADWGIFISKAAVLTNLISTITTLVANRSEEPVSAQPILLILAFIMNCLANFVGFSAFNTLGPRNADILTLKHQADRAKDSASIERLARENERLENENNSLERRLTQSTETTPFAAGIALRRHSSSPASEDETAPSSSITQPLLGPNEQRQLMNPAEPSHV